MDRLKTDLLRASWGWGAILGAALVIRYLIDWSGAEGNALSLHSAEGGNQFIQLISDSCYRSPL